MLDFFIMDPDIFTTVQVPGRICLFGDKIDLIGLPVIAAAVNTLLTVRIRARKDDRIKLYSENYQSGLEYARGEKGDWEHRLKYWCAITNRLKTRISGFEAIVNSNIPIGAGLSSSAAVSVGLVKALNFLFDLKMDNDQIAELAYRGEHDDLGIMCGRMDQYSIAHGGVSFIETGKKPNVIPLNLKSLPVVVGDSQEERQAKKILNNIKQRLNEKDPVVVEAFKTVHRGVLEGRIALEHGDYKKVGYLMTIQQKQENITGAATEKLNILCQEAVKAGALGAKQMGAGGGGCMVAVCPGKQKEVAAAITSAGGKAWIYDIFYYSNPK